MPDVWVVCHEGVDSHEVESVWTTAEAAELRMQEWIRLNPTPGLYGICITMCKLDGYAYPDGP